MKRQLSVLNIIQTTQTVSSQRFEDTWRGHNSSYHGCSGLKLKASMPTNLNRSDSVKT